ncbi:hypothetical protein BDP55DRAFT_396458 [Colletotrichum godetiae]|uniref:Zn(2)-C6 fungal-type domain-containing protein n=1 Tax=Colletotrichum godetiae TaxID=1209918 RepID=A0AAJ0A8P3_9PEZI|nr:uncharacterized protein BDP55DRAFT_396458 [Colletotrichum godetiae]KAK1658550.1 hypothetical protein BDP55DRAFT_396458 [Colletotrichum godetiae]
MRSQRRPKRKAPDGGDLPWGGFAIAKKSRIRKACNECRTLKTKCSMEAPCTTCRRRKVECSFLREPGNADRSLNPGQSLGVEVNQFEGAVNSKFPGHLRKLSPMLNDYNASVTASGEDAALQPESRSEPPMTHWVVYEQFNSGKLVHSGLWGSNCVPLDSVLGSHELTLQAMERYQCLRSERGYHDEYLNALMMVFPNMAIRIFYVAYLDHCPPNPLTPFLDSETIHNVDLTRVYCCTPSEVLKMDHHFSQSIPSRDMRN